MWKSGNLGRGKKAIGLKPAHALRDMRLAIPTTGGIIECHPQV
jgi:hypothetical protein